MAKEAVRCEWRVHACSSEAEVHEAANLLKSELFRVWQSAEPTDEAWVVLEALPPSAFYEMEIVNAGSALVEVYGMSDDCQHEDDDDYRMLLSAQQLMSSKDVINKANRNRSFSYSSSDKLSKLATQHRWRWIKVLCRQPFGVDEHKTGIGLSRISFKLCRTSSEMAAEAAEARLQESVRTDLAKLFPEGLSKDDGHGVVSHVTASMQHKAEEEVDTSADVTTPAGPHGKRRLPVWQSPSKQMRKVGKEAKSHDVFDREDEEGSDITKDSQKLKSVPEGSNSDMAWPSRRTGVNISKPSSDKVGTEAFSKGQQNKIGSHKDSCGASSKAPTPKSTKVSKPNKGACSSRPSPQEPSKGPSPQESTQQRNEGSPRSSSHQPFKGSSVKRAEPAKSEGSLRPRDSKGSSSKRLQTEIGEGSSRQASGQLKQAQDHPGSSPGQGNSEKEHDIRPKLPNASSIREPLQSSSREHAPKQAPFSKFLDGVVFALSGLVNPERAVIRDKALQMGGEYAPDWTSDCTLLVCAFANTPKFNQVKAANGTIVSKAWILECYEQKELVEIEKYLMHAGRPWRKMKSPVMDEFKNDDVGSYESMAIPASLQDVEKWVHEDVASSIAWLQQQESQPAAEALKSIAIQGIQLCLDDTIVCLKNKENIKKIMETWDFVPRAVQELARREDRAVNAKSQSTESDIIAEAERMKWIYSTELEKIASQEKQDVMDGQAEDDDATTDVMSDSDETEVLDEDDIREAEETLTKMLGKFD